MRVLHVHSGNLTGGVEAMLLTQVRSQSLCPELEHSFALCFAGQFSKDLLAEGAKVEWLGNVRIRRPWSVQRARRRLRELLVRETFDVVVMHSSWSQAIFGRTVQDAGLPLVFYAHAPVNGRHWLERWARRNVPDLVVCNSAFTAASLPQLYPNVKHETIHCAAAMKVDAHNQERKSIRVELQTPENAKVIIQVSRLEPGKGQLVHLKALSLLKDLPDWVCWQVGGSQRSVEDRYLLQLKQEVKGLGLGDRVRFLGQRSDVPRLLAAADIYCQPNTRPDSFGISLIEALYAKLPVVTAELGGACEIVNETCGVLVPSNDAEQLAVALRRLVLDQSLRARLGATGPRRASELCDPAARIEQFHNALGGIRARTRAAGVRA